MTIIGTNDGRKSFPHFGFEDHFCVTVLSWNFFGTVRRRLQQPPATQSNKMAAVKQRSPWRSVFPLDFGQACLAISDQVQGLGWSGPRL